MSRETPRYRWSQYLGERNWKLRPNLDCDPVTRSYFALLRLSGVRCPDERTAANRGEGMYTPEVPFTSREKPNYSDSRLLSQMFPSFRTPLQCAPTLGSIAWNRLPASEKPDSPLKDREPRKSHGRVSKVRCPSVCSAVNFHSARERTSECHRADRPGRRYANAFFLLFLDLPGARITLLRTLIEQRSPPSPCFRESSPTFWTKSEAKMFWTSAVVTDCRLSRWRAWGRGSSSAWIEMSDC